MSAQHTAEAGARQVLIERFPMMEGTYLYLLTADEDCPLLPVYQDGEIAIH
jgi:hypothetical protein